MSAVSSDDPRTRPIVTLAPGRHRRAGSGHPWIYSNEAVIDAAAKALPAGTLVTVAAGDGRRLGVASFNPHTLIALRLFDRDARIAIDAEFLAARVRRALALRDRLFDVPYYRLIHAEADGMPGLVVDRYGDALVVQLNMAGMALLEAPLLAALQDVLAPRAIILRNDSPARQQEGLEQEVRTACGEISGPFTLIENGATFMADLSAGQKTGWFYDQRPNRAFIARLARDASVLDVYSYTGGFGVLAAKAGAARVVMADRSEPALALAMRAAAANDVTGRCSTERGEAFALLDAHAAAGELFDLVLLDPPAFVKSKKDLAAGSRGYLKLIRAGVRLVAPGGFLFAASCSHNMPADTFAEIVRQALQEAGRRGRIIHSCGAGPDHPVHPSLPESAYLKGLTLALD